MKILIVDDEALVRVGMRALLPWEKHGYELVGEAVNGLQALEMARATQPDIALVDIIMPEMNGFEFVKKIRQELPLCKFIILSCMSDIEYYRKAIALGVSDYILKNTASADEILQAIDQVADKIRKEKEYSTETEPEEAALNKNLVLSDFLKSVIKKKIKDPALINKKLEAIGVNILTTKTFIIVLKSEFTDTSQGEYDGSLDHSVINLFQEIINSMGKGYVFVGQEEMITALIAYNGSRSEQDFLEDITYRLKETLQLYLDIVVTLGISKGIKAFEDIADSYFQALNALDKAFFKGAKIIYFFKETKPDENLHLFIIKEKELIQQMYSLFDADSVIKGMGAICDKLLLSESFSSDYAKKIYIDILYHVIEIAHKEMINLDEIIGKDFDAYNFVKNTLSLKELNQQVEDLILKLKSVYCNRFMKNKPSQIEQIKNYIDENIKDKISLHNISNEVHLSPDYVCRLFKKETGQNLVEYMLGKRIEKSKGMLLSGCTLSFVAEKLGFSSESHLIKTFRSITGLTPGQFVKKTTN